MLRDCLTAANHAILDHARENPECRGMGTTCTVLAVHQGAVFLAHIGDSRAYLLRDGTLTQISSDHTLAAQMVRDGTLTADQAAVSPNRHVLSRALGVDNEIQPDISAEEGVDGDRFVLCTDGLTDVVDDETIRQIVLKNDPAAACRALIDDARAAGTQGGQTTASNSPGLSRSGWQDTAQNARSHRHD